MSLLSIIVRAIAASIAYFRRGTLQRSKSARQNAGNGPAILLSVEAPPVAAGRLGPIADLNAYQGSDSRPSLLEVAPAAPSSAEEHVASPYASSSLANGGQPVIGRKSGDRDSDSSVQPAMAIAGEQISSECIIAAVLDVEVATLPADAAAPNVQQNGSVPAAAQDADGAAPMRSAPMTTQANRQARNGLPWCAAGAEHESSKTSEYVQQNASRDSKTASPSFLGADDGAGIEESFQAIPPSALVAEMAEDTARPEARAAASPNRLPVLGRDPVEEVRAGSHALSAAIEEIEPVRGDAACDMIGAEGAVGAAKSDILTSGAAAELTEEQSGQAGPNVALPNGGGAVDVRDELRPREAKQAPSESLATAGDSTGALALTTASNKADTPKIFEQNADIGIPKPRDQTIAGGTLAERLQGGFGEDDAFPGMALETDDSESNEPTPRAQSLDDAQTLSDDIPSIHAQVADDHHINADANAGVASESTVAAISDQPPEAPQIERRETGEHGQSAGPSAAKPPRRVSAYRDRRGQRRAPLPFEEPPASLENAASTKPGELKLRLSLSPIRRTAVLSIFLSRPEGCGERIALGSDNFCGEQLVQAYDQRRYDDIAIPWTPKLLDGELRAKSVHGYQWLRSSRRIHLFAEDLAEPGFVSVGGAIRGVLHAVVCRTGDVAAVSEIAASTGSPQLAGHPNWLGIPEGWAVLSGFRPAHEATIPVGATLTSLDPMAAIEIRFDGLGLRDRVFAEGRPPRILISEVPEGTKVTIGDQPASIGVDGGWQALGWDAPGARIVDVVPGPSAYYEIVQDPWRGDSWTFWDAHPKRFAQDASGLPWAEAEICGASVRAPGGKEIIAVEARPTLVALGPKGGVTPLMERRDLGVSVGAIAEPAAFLISATGNRRTQGRVVWLGAAAATRKREAADLRWAAAVYEASCRHLPLDAADGAGREAWRKAKERARRLRRLRQ